MAHRDLKPLNVFCQDRATFPTVKIGDFGSAARLNENEMVTEMAGTMAFMAPEVILGQPAGFMADVWSLGIILYALLAMELPFVSSE